MNGGHGRDGPKFKKSHTFDIQVNLSKLIGEPKAENLPRESPAVKFQNRPRLPSENLPTFNRSPLDSHTQIFHRENRKPKEV